MKEANEFLELRALLGVLIVAFAVLLIAFLRKMVLTNNSLNEALSRIDILLNDSSDPMICVGVKGEIVRFNKQAELLFGYQPHEVLGEKIEMLVPKRYRSSHRSMRDGYFKAPKNRQMGAGINLQALTKDG